MTVIARAILRLLLSNALLLAIPLTAAADEPTPTPKTTVGRAGISWDDRDISAAAKAEGRAALHIMRTSIGAGHWSTLNYKKAKENDKGSVKARRKFASAWLWSGKKISNITAAELAKVKGYSDGKPPFPGVAAAVVCHGRSDVTGRVSVAQDVFDTKIWMNSCQTAAVKFWLNSVAGTVGVLAGLELFIGNNELLATQLALACAEVLIGANVLDYYATVSDLGATWIRDHWHLISVGAQ